MENVLTGGFNTFDRSDQREKKQEKMVVTKNFKFLAQTQSKLKFNGFQKGFQIIIASADLQTVFQ